MKGAHDRRPTNQILREKYWFSAMNGMKKLINTNRNPKATDIDQLKEPQNVVCMDLREPCLEYPDCHCNLIFINPAVAKVNSSAFTLTRGEGSLRSFSPHMGFERRGHLTADHHLGTGHYLSPARGGGGQDPGEVINFQDYRRGDQS